MPRRLLIRSKNLPYHVTSRSNNKAWFSLSMPTMWSLSQESLKEAMLIHKVEVISYVLMGNHYHMILLTPNGNLDSFMYEFNKRFALKIKKQTGQIDKIFGNRYKWCLIQSQTYLMNCYRYVYQNPIRAGVVKKCEDYPYSTLSTMINNKTFSVPIHDRFGFKDGYCINWLNQRIADEEVVTLKKKLSRSVIVEIR